MKLFKSNIVRTLLVIIMLMSGFILNTLYQAGVFTQLKYHSKLSKSTIETSMPGTEDLALDEANARIFISSSNRRLTEAGQKSDDGIFVIELESNTAPVKLLTNYEGELHPHGISFLSKQGVDYLFVVNHNNKGSFVEKFIIDNNYLHHVKSYENELMCCPNDLVAVDVEQFYVTNDHGAESGWMRTVEDYLKIANASVLYFNGSTFQTVYENLNFANGIALTKDGKTLYVTETTSRRLSVLDRDILTGRLSLKFIKNLETGLDNITLDQQENLWIAAHPKLLDFVAHAKDAKNLSPSQILKLTPIDNDFQVTEIYLDDGQEISGSSTALFYDGIVYVGVVFENKLLMAEYQDVVTEDKNILK